MTYVFCKGIMLNICVIFFLLDRSSALIDRRATICYGSLGMENGAIDEDYFAININTVTDDSQKCGVGRYGPRVGQDMFWCSSTDESGLNINFPHRVSIHGCHYEFQSSSSALTSVQFQMDVSDDNSLRTYGILKKGSDYDKGFVVSGNSPLSPSWDSVSLVKAKLIAYRTSNTGLKKVKFEINGCWKKDYGTALISFGDLGIVTSASAGTSEFLHQVLFNSGGSGWNPNDLTVRQQDVSVEKYYLQVEFKEIKKVFSIFIQQDWKMADGTYWVKYGLNASTLTEYKDSNGATKIIKPPLNSYGDCVHYFLRSLTLKVFRLIPICGNSDQSCASIKFQLYGVKHKQLYYNGSKDDYKYISTNTDSIGDSLLSADHFWKLWKNKYYDQYGGLDGEGTNGFIEGNHYLRSYHQDKPSFRTDYIPKTDCIINPDKCENGLTVSMDVYQNSIRSAHYSWIVSNNNFRQVDSNGQCNDLDGSTFYADRTIGIYLYTVNLIPYHKVVTGNFRFKSHLGKNKPSVYFDGYLYLDVSRDLFDQCRFEEYNTPFRSDINFYTNQHGTGYLANFNNLLNQAVNSSLWYFGNPIMLVLKPKDTTPSPTEMAILSQTSIRKYFGSFFDCLGYEEYIVDSLPASSFSESSPCNQAGHGASDIRFKENGWLNCASGNVLKIDLKTPYTIVMAVVKGITLSAERSVITKFSINHSLDDVKWTSLSINFVFQRRLSAPYDKEYLPLPRAIHARYIKLFPLDYTGIAHGGMKFDILVCRNKTFTKSTRYLTSTSVYPIVSGGLHRSGSSYLGTGFYIGSIYVSSSKSRLVYAIQTDTELYENIVDVSYHFSYQLTLTWDKHNKKLHLYGNGNILSSADPIPRLKENTPGYSFSDYIVIGSKYDHTVIYNYLMVADLAIWKDTLSSEEVNQHYSTELLEFDDQNDGAAQGISARVRQWCTFPRMSDGLCYDLTQQKNNDVNVLNRGCPPSWKSVNGYCYYFSDTAKKFEDARNFCLENGADLTSIISQEENGGLTSLLKESQYADEYMIGLNGLRVPSEFSWSNSDEFPAENMYVNWGPGEPNNYGGREDCGELLSSGYWNDISCSDTKYYICKKVVDPCPISWVSRNGRCYYFSPDTKSYYDARTACQGMGAYLVNIENYEESQFLRASSPTSASYYIGVQDMAKEGIFQWDEPFPKDERISWIDFEDNPTNGLCTKLTETGEWKNVDCATPMKFICQRISPFHRTTKPTFWRQYKDVSGTKSCQDSVTQLGQCTDGKLNMLHNYVMFRPSVSTNVYVKRAILTFRFTSRTDVPVSFGLVWTDIDIQSSTNCNKYTERNTRLIRHLEFALSPKAAISIKNIDVTQYVTHAVNEPDWYQKKRSITFLIYQKMVPKCLHQRTINIDSSEVTLDIHYDDMKPHKFLAFLPSESFSKYHTYPVSKKMTAMSFWVWKSGRDDSILVVSLNDITSGPLVAVIPGDLGKNWVKVVVNMSTFLSYRKRVYFNLYNHRHQNSQVGIDKIETFVNFFPESEVTTQYTPNYIDKDKLLFKEPDYGSFNLPKPLMIYPFRGYSSQKYYLHDYGPHELHFTYTGCNSYHFIADWLQLPHGSFRIGGTCNKQSFKMMVEDTSKAAGLIDKEFSVLFHVKCVYSYDHLLLQLGNNTDHLKMGISQRDSKLVFWIQENGKNATEMFYGQSTLSKTTHEYIGFIFAEKNVTLIRNTEIVTVLHLSLSSFTMPTSLYLFRDPALFGNSNGQLSYSYMSCLQFYNKVLSMLEVKALKFCPVMQDHNYYPEKCINGGMPDFGQPRCLCPNSRFVYRTCKHALGVVYKDALLYVSFDTEKVAEKGDFQFVDSVQSTQNSDGFFNGATCYSFTSTDETLIGELKTSCLSDFTGCSNGYVVNVWLRIHNYRGIKTEHNILSIGDLKIFLEHNQTDTYSPSAKLQWKNNNCQFYFDLVDKAWTLLSISVTPQGLELYKNGVLQVPDSICQVPSLSPGSKVDLKVGKAIFCIDDLLILPIESSTNTSMFYYTFLTGKGLSNTSHPRSTIYETYPEVNIHITSYDLPTSIITMLNEGSHTQLYYRLQDVIDAIVPMYLENSLYLDAKKPETFGNKIVSWRLGSGNLVNITVRTGVSPVSFDWIEAVKVQQVEYNYKNYQLQTSLDDVSLLPNKPILSIKELGSITTEIQVNNSLPSYTGYKVDISLLLSDGDVNYLEDHSYGLDVIFLQNLKTNRNYSVKVIGYSHYGISAESETLYFTTMGSVNFEPPVITDIRNNSMSSCYLTWTYDVLDLNSDYNTFYVTWKNVNSGDGILGKFTDLVLRTYENLRFRFILTDLEYFTNYSITLTTYNDYGFGLGTTEVYCKTDEGPGDFGPTILSITGVSPTTINIVWDGFIEIEDEEILNSIEFSGYQIMIAPMYDELSIVDPVNFNYTVDKTVTSLESRDLDEFALFKLNISSVNAYGIGIPNSICFATPEGVPSSGPTVLKNLELRPFSVVLEIGEIEHVHENGIVLFYNVSFTSLNWPGVWHSFNSVSYNHSEHNIDLWNVMRNITYNCSVFAQVKNPPSTTEHIVNNFTELFPHTEYSIDVYGCTVVGCSNVSSNVTIKTLALLPACSPNFTMTNDSSTSMLVQWKHLDHTCLYGDLVEYIVFIFESSISLNENKTNDFDYFKSIKTEKSSTSDNFTTLTSLRKYWNYTAVLFTKNHVGMSPPSYLEWAMTEEDRPDGPPTNITMFAINSTAIAINMSIPERDKVNGIILGYEVNISTSIDQLAPVIFDRFDNLIIQTEVKYGGLRKFFDHKVTIKAFTKFGSGPSNITIIKTLEDIPSAPPKNFMVYTTSFDHLVLIWDRIEFLLTHGVMRHFNVYLSGILANGTWQHLHHTVLFNETDQSFLLNVTHLFPATIYNISLQGCTSPGCGPFVNITQRTNELEPSGVVQSITRFDVNLTESLHFNWTNIQPMERRGVITHWNISFDKREYEWDLDIDTIQYFKVANDVFTMSFFNLDNYTDYSIGVTGYTKIGRGPTKEIVYRTATNIPTKAPNVTSFENISSSALKFTFLPLENVSREGVLTGYLVLFRLLEEHELCTAYDNCTEMNSTFCKFDNITECEIFGLKLNTNYTAKIAAVTSAGIGPFTALWEAQTDYFSDGNWTSWSEWGNCDQSCGSGFERKYRWCTNPEPSGGGKYCDGLPIDKRKCNEFTCPSFYLSIPGVNCEELCPQINSTYICANMIETDDSTKVFESARDPLNYTLEANITCKTEIASEKYTSYAHPSFNMTSGVCSGFKDMPERINCSLPFEPSSEIRRLCYCVDKESLIYKEWAEWSLCSKSCGIGTKQRFRNCIIPSVYDNTRDTNDCNVFQCPIDGGWAVWTDYSECDRTCGFGVLKRHRMCTDPKPRFGGEDCVGVSEEMISGCNPYPCPVNGGWSEWTNSEYCSNPCGIDGYIQKRRYCNNPEPKYNGTYCEGSAFGRDECNRDVKCKPIKVTFVVKLVEFVWHYTMVYDTTPTYKNVSISLKNAIKTVLKASQVGLKNFHNVVINGFSRGSVISNFSVEYNAAPFVEVVAIQNAIDKIGFIDSLRVQHINVSSTDVPSNPPSFVAVSRTPYTIDVSWNHTLGNLSNNFYVYYIFYRLVKSDNATWEFIATKNKSITLVDLEPNTLYGLRLTVSIAEGNGVATREIDIETLEGLPFIAPPNFEYILMDYQTVYLSWEEIPPNKVPGLLGGYVILVREYFGNTSFSMRTGADLLQRTVKGLKPNMWYWVEVGGFTTSGPGPLSLVVFKTPYGPPGIPPPNVTLWDLYTTDAINITWDAIPEEEQNGYMLGYKLRYQLVRTGGVDITVGNPPVTLTFDRFVFAHEIRGLKAYSEYKIELLGYASEGDGPAYTLVASTCRCPAVLYTNFYQEKPFCQRNPNNKSQVIGLFPDLLKMIVDNVCVDCKGYKRSILYYDRTYAGYPAEKLRSSDVKASVDMGSHLNFPIFYNFEHQYFSGSFPYVGIVRVQGSALIVFNPKVKTVGMLAILTSISNAWSVILVAVLLAMLCGWCFWFTEQSSNESEVAIDRSIQGACQGAWLAYITMTTVGYGDFVPTTNLSKVLMTIWALIGLVTMGVVTGVISSGMTVGELDEVIKLYGTKTATLPGTYERYLAIVRNAIINKDENYITPYDIFNAVLNGTVKIGLLNAVVAAEYEDVLEEMSLRVDQIIDTDSGFGVALSGGFQAIENDMRSYVLSNQAFIDLFVKQKVKTLIPSLPDIEAELISIDEVNLIMKFSGIIFVVLCFFGIIVWLWRLKKKRVVKPEGPFTSEKMFEEFDDVVSSFHSAYINKMDNLQHIHFKDIKELTFLRKNYERLLVRTGFDHNVVAQTFEKKRKKDEYKIMKDHRNKKYAYMRKNNTD